MIRVITTKRSMLRDPIAQLEDSSQYIHEIQESKRRIDDRIDDPTPARRASRKTWHCPSDGSLKLNMDAAIHEGRGCMDAAAELIAIREGLLFAEACALHVSYVESDCLAAVQAINSSGGLSPIDLVVGDIISLMSVGSSGPCNFCP
ncbi:hypothetical protein TorRG33x02_323610 [Trema orientale]|uniref:RNase H type-1 domain-containing protein n=1 Tax=Trema orientale TaxID=63057 RepID=A0A2P5BF23_TREOI|nr:hypothetical protein TorRG33x02_323610 [Trema orientale]